MSRQIILDTETTGIYPKNGDRIVEIGCVEMIDRALTGNHFHVYINPERDMPEEAYNVHGLSSEFLSDKPLFSEIAEDFLSYINCAELIIHNAPFDMGFLDHELSLINRPSLSSQCSVIDTLKLAKEKYPGQRNNLDALCKRLEIDNSKRTLHGALLDSEILAQVYLAMTGGQEMLFSAESTENNLSSNLTSHSIHMSNSSSQTTRIIKATDQEVLIHQNFLTNILKIN